MSILFNGSYVNSKQQLWESFNGHPTITVDCAFTTATLSDGVAYSVSNLTIGAQYNFRFNLGLYCPPGDLIPLATLNDGTNAVTLACSAFGTISNVNLPIELKASSTSNITTTNFPGAINTYPMWCATYSSGVNTSVIAMLNEITLTPLTTTLYFIILANSSASSVIADDKILMGGNIKYTQISL